MSIGEMLSSLTIGPLKLLFEIIFSLAHRVLSPGMSIVILSLAVNLLVLPLYRRADALQEEERAKEKELSHWVNHIKVTFKGDQRYMILQEYYRQNSYSPLHALKGALPLLLQIPFFIAAYQMLSGLEELQGASFGPIKDLNAQDRLISIFGMRINLLPILMTGVNILSGALYSQNAPLKSKLQVYLTALVFLVLLYRSPSGLTLYWTLNNVFSLTKNLWKRLGLSPKVALFSLAAMGLMIIAFAISGTISMKVKAVCGAIGFALVVYAVYQLSQKGGDRKQKEIENKSNYKNFICSVSLVSVLTGLLIPSSVLSSSPAEFMEGPYPLNPIWFVINAFLLAIGTFAVWGSVFYLLANGKIRREMELGTWVLGGTMLLNYMVFRKSTLFLNSVLQYELVPSFSLQQKVTNALVLAALVVIMIVIWNKKVEVSRIVSLVGALAVCVMGIRNVALSVPEINQAMATIRDNQQRGEKPTIPLSRNGKNVVVIMLDRAIDSYVPVILNELPEVRRQYEGFTWYPNTLSHGRTTNLGAPGLYGGYEYTPAAMNERPADSLQKKHNEALLVLPTLFNDSGYIVTVCDPPYAGNYRVTTDLSLYDHLEHTKAFLTDGIFMDQDYSIIFQKIRFRNFFCYSLSEILPYFLYGPFYNCGFYNESTALYTTQLRNGYSVSQGIEYTFLKAYTVLTQLPVITEVQDDAEGTLLMMCNKTTHEPALLKEPYYSPEKSIDNTAYDKAHEDRFSAGEMPLKTDSVDQMTHYHANAAALIQIGNWLDYLKAEGVYDNTRIILVADHGRFLYQMEGMELPDGSDLMAYNPLLMVKDFEKRGDILVDHQFMTNADVPTIATRDVIENPANPFTGRPIQGAKDKLEPQKVTTSFEYNVATNRGNTFLPSYWYSVHDNIFDSDNWEDLGFK